MSSWWLFLLVPAVLAGYLVRVYQETCRKLELGGLLHWLLDRGHVDAALRVVRVGMLRHARERVRLLAAKEQQAPRRRDAA